MSTNTSLNMLRGANQCAGKLRPIGSLWLRSGGCDWFGRM
jgi:hypothetical protein